MLKSTPALFRSAQLRRVACHVALCLAALVGTGFAMAQTPPLRLAPLGQPPLTEELGAVEVARQRADAVYGMVSGAPARSITFPLTKDHPMLTVSGLSVKDRSLCLEIYRADGAYRASGEITLTKGATSLEIPLDSSPAARDLMNRAPAFAGEMAVRARAARARACSSQSPWLRVTWAGPETASKSLYLAVGGAALGIPSVRINNGPLAQCEPVSNLVNRPDLNGMIFSSLCQIDQLFQVCKGTRAAQNVKVLWQQLDRVTAEADLKVASGCP